MNWTALKTEIAKPAYASMTNAQVADAMNAPIADTSDRDTLTGGEILSVTDRAEYAALVAADKSFFNLLAAGGTMPLTPNLKTILGGLFGPGTTTRTRMQALMRRSGPTSLSRQFGFDRPMDFADIAKARTI